MVIVFLGPKEDHSRWIRCRVQVLCDSTTRTLNGRFERVNAIRHFVHCISLSHTSVLNLLVALVEPRLDLREQRVDPIPQLLRCGNLAHGRAVEGIGTWLVLLPR